MLQLERRDDSGTFQSYGSLDKQTVARALERGEPAAFPAVTAGTYRVTALTDAASHLAFAFSRPFEVASGRSTDVSLELGSGTVIGGWVKGSTGAPVDSVSIRFAECSTAWSVSGNYIEARIPRNTPLTAIIGANNHQDAEVRVSPGDTKLRTIQLHPKRD